jgi:hypothetical protein
MNKTYVDSVLSETDYAIQTLSGIIKEHVATYGPYQDEIKVNVDLNILAVCADDLEDLRGIVRNYQSNNTESATSV